MIHTHSSPNIILFIKSRIMRLAGHVERMGGRTGTYRVWREDLTERDHLQDLDIDGMIISKWMLKKWDGMSRTGLIWLRIGTGGGLL
jgi:hypothetical protein